MDYKEKIYEIKESIKAELTDILSQHNNYISFIDEDGENLSEDGYWTNVNVDNYYLRDLPIIQQDYADGVSLGNDGKLYAETSHYGSVVLENIDDLINILNDVKYIVSNYKVYRFNFRVKTSIKAENLNDAKIQFENIQLPSEVKFVELVSIEDENNNEIE